MRHFLVFLAFILTAPLASATDRSSSPQSIEQSYGRNYKDMVLATCVANAYKGDENAAKDAGSSASALRDWTYYDLEKSPDEVKALVNSYLGRSYKNQLVEAEVKGVRFDFLKCLDLYHSKELDSLAKKIVINPNHTYKQDNP
ncbi:type VI secretion system amidase immunity protein Tai4 [Pseudomonas sp. CFBP 8772]|uniref:type VI secretion system amidase immunity protein Tai4 n=1 Tax=Pseudomonas sp. CFBP 8772 TaxID=2775284 RepID=UPI0017831601|nr:type VI secretion system amidase immunity protein Tai4 [Pseudomonas sp. CFBP 8772]MBD8598174.1 type VI secretion system amidase immunity protein Tai4 [Pseudomonas sp. CFBP 8772]